MLHRDGLNESQNMDGPELWDSFGNATVTRTSRYQQYQVKVDGGFQDIIGLEVFRNES